MDGVTTPFATVLAVLLCVCLTVRGSGGVQAVGPVEGRFGVYRVGFVVAGS